MGQQLQGLSENYFTYDRHKFFLSISLYTFDIPKYKVEVQLNTSSIISFSYVNELNKLCLEGEIVYQDNNAMVDKVLERPLVWCDVLLSQMEQKFDEQVTIEKEDESARFRHTFFLDSVKIMKREGHVITYKLSLMSSNWMKCIKHLQFSNYGQRPQPAVDIIKAMLSMNGLTVDKESFERAGSQVKLNYITNGHDNTFTTVKWLLAKMFYYDQRELSLKSITYNEQSGMYGIFNPMDRCTQSDIPSILLSLFKSSTENLLVEEPNELNAVSKCPKTCTYEGELGVTLTDYNYSENAFTDKLIASKSIVQYKNGFFETEQYRPKFEHFREREYMVRGSYWSNEFDAYHAAMKSMMEDNAIVINTSGEVSRKPGMYIILNVDRNLQSVSSEQPDELKDLKDRYKSLEGLYIIAKVRHIVTPSQLNGEKRRYRQNLVLMRNFVSAN